MKKPNKIYNLTIVYSGKDEQIEYIEETLELDDADRDYGILDLSETWDKESLEVILNHYTLAEA